MVSWNDFYARVKEKVEKIIKEREVFDGSLIFNNIVGEVMKEHMLEEGSFKIKEVERDDYKDVTPYRVLYRDDSKFKIKRGKK